jgi:integrase
MRQIREISNRHSCPCGTGRSYEECCKTQAFKWVRDNRGRVFQQVPLSKEAADAIKEHFHVTEADFLRTLRRGRKNGERPDIGSYLERRNAFADEVAHAMEAAGADPAWIHAFRKTGLLVTEKNERLIPTADLEEWDSAVAEYRTDAAGRRRQAVSDRALERVFEDYCRYPYVLGKFVGAPLWTS